MLKCPCAPACILIISYIGTGDNVFTKVSRVSSCDACCSCVATPVSFGFDRFFAGSLPYLLRAVVTMYAAPVISRGPNTIAGLRTATPLPKK